jgi:hypothetical protein
MSAIGSTPVVTIDSRGPRFAATITTLVLAVALVSSNHWFLVAQGIVFAIGAIRGPQFTPYGFVFKKFIKPTLGADAHPEDVRPPQFAQAVGLVFAVVGSIAALAGASTVFTVSVAFALGAAFLNAAFNFCLGCEMYLILVRLTNK